MCKKDLPCPNPLPWKIKGVQTQVSSSESAHGLLHATYSVIDSESTNFSQNKFRTLNDICQDCNNRTCICDIASVQNVLNTDSLSETNNMNIS